MPGPPPRKTVSCSTKSGSKRDTNPLEILLQMGFPKNRALKALAATGNRSTQLALDWLLAHVNDAYIDEDQPREYTLYAIPSGPFLNQLHHFWEKSRAIGWNGAHNLLPHITLVPFFKGSDETALQLGNLVKNVIESVGPTPSSSIKLEPYISPNYMGLFVSEEHADYLKKIALKFSEHLSSVLGVKDILTRLDTCTITEENPNSAAKTPQSDLHLTLAHQFDVAAYDGLKKLVDNLDFRILQPAWEFRLYSRDPRFNDHQVYKVTQSYAADVSDELELVLGDYIYVEQKQFDSSPDGWVHGTSWLTGVSGQLKGEYTRRTSKSDVWTLHRAISTCKSLNNSGDNRSDSENYTDVKMATDYPHEDSEQLGYEKSEEAHRTWQQYWQTAMKDGTENILNDSDGKDNTSNGVSDSNKEKSKNDVNKEGTSRRWIFAMRHGERVDLTYGTWVPFCFDENGTYIRKDLNMPLSLPPRVGGAESYGRDTPLTRMGRMQAFLVGEGLRAAATPLRHVYASPALRCVESAHNMLQGLQAGPSVKIRVEPGLFEYKMWHTAKGLGPFMTPLELQKAGYNVDLSYKSYLELDVNAPETLNEFYKRNEIVIQSIVNDTEAEGGNIMFVGHAATLDIMVTAIRRMLDKKTDFPEYKVVNFLNRVPYCALGAMRDKPWEIVSPPCPPSINSCSGRFDWKLLYGVQNE